MGRLHSIEVALHHETKPGEPDEGAILVSLTGEKDQGVWLPKSQCEFEHKAGRIVKVTAPEWFLTDKGLL